MGNHPFIAGQEYHRRSDIHAKFRGQERGGIITPAAHPYVILVTGEAGKEHGYTDSWSADGKIFHYFGEGQSGDMLFIKGNRAIRDHQNDRKQILLFEQVKRRKGWLRFIGEMICVGHAEVDALDRQNRSRKAIVFHLQTAD